ncbi:MAG: hypothetical protein ACI83O_000047 [Patescibacteria group bacterium]|jgi:hypothetical protein
MITEIIKEKTSADHLLYVSLKYTKTCDVILNLLARWKSLIELSFDSIIQVKVDAGVIPGMPASPKERIEFVRKYFTEYKNILAIIPTYVFFKRVPDAPKTREGEFRKNVNLKVKLPNDVISVNLLQLEEYSTLMDDFMKDIKEIVIHTEE